MEHLKKLREYAKTIELKPGVYRFFDEKNNLLYVGKAKNLRKRILSYFYKNYNKSPKLKLLLKKLRKIEVIVTENEYEALLLENNLIKNSKPKYNTLLKDDKTYPWFKITNEDFPRVIKTRKIEKDNALYFGPFTSNYMIKTIEELLVDVFNVRICKLKLTNENVKNSKFKPCIQYQIKKCLAPCSGQNIKEYKENINLIKHFFEGNLNAIEAYFLNKIKFYSKNLEFEKAHHLKTKLDLLKNFQYKSAVSLNSDLNINVLTYVVEAKIFFFNFLKIKNGLVIQSLNFYIKPPFLENDDNVVNLAINYLIEKFKINEKNFLLKEHKNIIIPGINIILPETDENYLKLIKLSELNAKTYAKNYTINEIQKKYGKFNHKLLLELKETLHLKNLPIKIECFDISHLQGENMVGSCIVFTNGKPNKKEYRRFNIKTLNKIDDYSALSEIIYRRIKRLVDENKKLPDLIIVDGGKGQLNAALSCLKKLNIENIDVISIAKRLETIYIKDSPYPVYLKKNSNILRLIQQIRNEAHRFAITFHKKKKIKSHFSSIFNNIKGIGKKSIEKILKNFNSIDDLNFENFDKLSSLIGRKKAEILLNYINQLKLKT